MSLAESVKIIYPGIQGHQYRVEDHGNGPFITVWDYDQPEPTAAQLQEALALWSAQSVIREAQRELAELDPLLPRSVEDLVAVLGMPTSSLPQVMRERMDRKAELRAIICGGDAQ